MTKKQTILSILLLALNLRLAVTAITPLFAAIQTSLQVSSTVTALLVTIPLLCFSAGAILTPKLLATYGVRPLLVGATALLTLANLFRPFTTVTLLLGTVLIGAAIALLNVLVPVMIAQITTSALETTRLTSYYSVTMNLMGAIGTAVAMPLAHWMGWATVLRLFAFPALLAFLVCLKQPQRVVTTERPAEQVSLWQTLRHDRQALRLTVFMGLQSLIFYSLIAWLPAIFQSLGTSANEAGLLLAVFQLIGIPAALALNVLTNPKRLLELLAVGYLLGLFAMFWHGIGWWVAAIVLGLTCSLIFSVALNFIATSSQNVTRVAHRSALAQSLGYLLAALGPVLLGQLHDACGNWQVVLGVFEGLMVLTILAGWWTVQGQSRAN